MSEINRDDLTDIVVSAAVIMASADGFNVKEFPDAPILQSYYKRAIALDNAGILNYVASAGSCDFPKDDVETPKTPSERFGEPSVAEVHKNASKPVSDPSEAPKPTVEQVSVNGELFDVPTWMSQTEFVDALTSENAFEPLSHLVHCSFVKFVKNPHYYPGGTEESEFCSEFDVKFLVPFDGIAELVCNRFAPPANMFDGRNINIEITDTGALISMRVSEYCDFNDVQAFVLPRDLSKHPENTGNDWFDETLEELREDFETTVEDITGWDGKYVEFTTPDGEDYFVLLKVHED